MPLYFERVYAEAQPERVAAPIQNTSSMCVALRPPLVALIPPLSSHTDIILNTDAHVRWFD